VKAAIEAKPACHGVAQRVRVDAELEPRMRGQRVLCRKLQRHLVRQLLVNALGLYQARKLPQAIGRVLRELRAFAIELRALRVAPTRNRNIFADRHRNRTGHERRNARNHQGLVAHRRARHADDHAGGGDDAVVGAHHAGAQPVQPARDLSRLQVPGDIGTRCRLGHRGSMLALCS